MLFGFLVLQTWLLPKDEAGGRLEETFLVQLIQDVLWLKYTKVVAKLRFPSVTVNGAHRSRF